jgi:AcrR family transcriptional regulator
MSDVATAAATKAGLYHHVSSKEGLLYTVLDFGLDLTESRDEAARGDCRSARTAGTMIELHLRLVLGQEPRSYGSAARVKTLSYGSGEDQPPQKEYVNMSTKLIADV